MPVKKKNATTRFEQLVNFVKKTKKGRTYTELCKFISLKWNKNDSFCADMDRGLASKYLPRLREVCMKSDTGRYVYSGTIVY